MNKQDVAGRDWTKTQFVDRFMRGAALCSLQLEHYDAGRHLSVGPASTPRCGSE